MLETETIIRLERDRVVLLDQRRLPDEEVELACGSAAEVAEAIRALAIRGAPAIGVAAAYGYALAAAREEDLDAACSVLAAARPTAVNLEWALREVRAAAEGLARLAAARAPVAMTAPRVSRAASGHVQSSKPVCAGSKTLLLFSTKLPRADDRAHLTLCATNRLMHRSKLSPYSMTSAAEGTDGGRNRRSASGL